MALATGFSTSPSPTIILFGPQKTRLSQISIPDLTSTLQKDPKFSFLLDQVRSLPALWRDIRGSCPIFEQVSEDRELEVLADLLCNGTTLDIHELGCISLVPLTIIIQIVEYLQCNQSGNFQGFCVGFLTAAAAAFSSNREEFQNLSCNALNLAVCLGAAIDADALRAEPSHSTAETLSVAWQDNGQQRILDTILQDFPHSYQSCITDLNRASVTVNSIELPNFTQACSEANLTIVPTGLQGRYHLHSSSAVAAELKQLCRNDRRFRLPDASELKSPLRSNVDSAVVTQANLSDVVIDSILCKQSNWYDVVHATVESMDNTDLQVLQVGGKGTFPHSLMRLVPNTRVGVLDFDGNISSVAKAQRTPKSSAQTPVTGRNSADTVAQPLREPIAIVGVSCRYPQSDSVSDFWDLIAAGDCAVRPLTRDRFDASQLNRNPKGPFSGAFLDSPDAFDHRFFGISGREAKSMDPQQRLVLQVAYEALESGGYAERTKSANQNIGCYLGVGSVDYDANVASDHANAFSATGTLRAFISGRASHYFGWTGPSVTFDTACSSSAVAIHSACKALQLGECSMAVAGGVNVITAPFLYQNLAAASFLNPDGASKAFDSSGNGYCRGEGCGLVLLRPLKDAVASNDFILGVISGSAINQGSNSSPITVPHSASQSSLYQNVLGQANMDPANVSYVEAHGTGTPVGDPIEAESIRNTLGGSKRAKQLGLGSVKDNIGHAEAASGAAGLVKILMMLHHRVVPKQANFKRLNPNISPLEPDQMFVPTATTQWKVPHRVAMVNNYGAAGSNAAILVEEHRKSPSGKAPLLGHTLPFAISANTEESMREYGRALSSHLRKIQASGAEASLADIAFNLAHRRNDDLRLSHHFLSSDHKTLFAQLEQVASGDAFSTKPDKAPSCIMCFGGQTGKPAFISRDVYDVSPALRAHLIECDEVLAQLGLKSLFPAIFNADRDEDIVLQHCELFAIQYASAKAWISSGVRPDALIGHSFGQITALSIGGTISLSDAMKLVSCRARLIRDEWGDETGAMLSVEGPLSDVKELLYTTKQNDPSALAEIVCYNGPESHVVGGRCSAIDAIERTHSSWAHSESTKLTKLASSHAYHSQLTEAIIPGLEVAASSLSLRSPDMHVETCSEGSTWTQFDAEKLVEHTRQPVYFQAAIERICRKHDANVVWLEAGSGSPIIPLVKHIVKDKTRNTFLPINLSEAGALDNLARATCTLGKLGIKSLFWPFHRSRVDIFPWMPLPPYQFEKNKHWIDLKIPAAVEKESAPSMPPLKGLIHLVEKEHESAATLAVNVDDEFYRLCVSGHAVLGQPLCPASMYCELAVSAVALVTNNDDHTRALRVQQLRILSPLTLKPTGPLSLRLELETAGGSWNFTLFTRSPQASDAKQTIHATGTINSQAGDSAESSFQSFEKLVSTSKCRQISSAATAETLSGRIIYKVFGRTVDYAPYFQGVKRVTSDDNEAVGDVFVPSDQPDPLAKSATGPILLDNCLQVAGIHVNCLCPCSEDEVFVCTGIEEISFRQSFRSSVNNHQPWTVYCNFRDMQKGKTMSDIYVLDGTSQNLVSIFHGVQFTSVSLKFLTKTLSKLNDAHNAVDPGPDSTSFSRSPPKGMQLNTVRAPVTPPSSGDKSPISMESGDQSGEDTDSADDQMMPMRKLISEILEIPLEEALLSALLIELGIDSLMSTDVATEIQRQFNYSITGTEIAAMSTLDDLCQRVLGSVPAAKTSKPKSSKKHSIAKQVIGVPSVPNTEVTPSSTPDEGIFPVAELLMDERKNSYNSVIDEADFKGYISEVYPYQAELVLAYIAHAFNALGCDLVALPAGAELPTLQFAKKHSKAVQQYMAALQEGNIIEKHPNDRFIRTDVPLPRRGPADLSEAIINRFPRHASEHKLLHSTGAHLADCLREAKDPVGLLFGNAKARDLMEDVYTNAPMFKAGTIFLARYLREVIDSSNTSRTVRILELGAGTGGTTGYLLSKLIGSDRKFQYTFTDLSPSLVAMAKKKYSKYDFMEYAVIDIEKIQPAHMLQSFDIVISTNCIHATRNLVNSCSNINALLRKDGILCLIELTQNLFWFDLVFGLLEGWWLFNDGRKHALASPAIWDKSLRASGFNWVEWTQDKAEESNIVRLIVASSSQRPTSLDSVNRVAALEDQLPVVTKETQTFKEVNDLQLQADIYYPSDVELASARPRPVALMIHGGGHIMLSRRNMRQEQTSYLHQLGFLPVSIDYRLCPETTLHEGPMTDVRDALEWVRRKLPTLELKRRDISVDSSNVVIVGWSTGGHLAMTLAWTPLQIDLAPPQAILAFYCPTDYESGFWSRPNVPRGSEQAAAELSLHRDKLIQGVYDGPIVAYNPHSSTKPVGGWMAPSDARSRLALWMNWRGMHLPLLLNGLKKDDTLPCDTNGEIVLPTPTTAQVRAVSPLAAITTGRYQTPTFIVHGTRDDLIPWEQARATYDALVVNGVQAECRIVEDAIHLFDVEPGWEKVAGQGKAVWEGYDFLARCAGL